MDEELPGLLRRPHEKSAILGGSLPTLNYDDEMYRLDLSKRVADCRAFREVDNGFETDDDAKDPARFVRFLKIRGATRPTEARREDNLVSLTLTNALHRWLHTVGIEQSVYTYSGSLQKRTMLADGTMMSLDIWAARFLLPYCPDEKLGELEESPTDNEFQRDHET